MASSARSTTIGYAQPNNAAQVRLNLVGRYFAQWASMTLQRIFKAQLEEKLAYLDMTACQTGENPADWLPAALLPWANRHRTLRQQLFTILHDLDETRLESLQQQLQQPETIHRLAFEPQWSAGLLDATVKKAVAKVRSLPTLMVLDFCHYEGVTWDWLYELVQRHGAEVVLTIDVTWVLKHLNRKKQRSQLVRLLGEVGLEQLQTAFKAQRCSYAQKVQQCWTVLQTHLKDTLEDTTEGGCLRFTFCDERERPSQWLLFLTAKDAPYTLMRQIMTEESQYLVDGIGDLQYIPNQPTQQVVQSPTLFGPLFKLEQELLHHYKNQTIQLIDLYQAHHRGRSLIRQNYHDALLRLEEQGAIKITRERPGRGRQFPKSHLTDKAFISFKAPC